MIIRMGIVLLFMLFLGCQAYGFEEPAFTIDQHVQAAYNQTPYRPVSDGVDTTKVLVAGARHASGYSDVPVQLKKIEETAVENEDVVVTSCVEWNGECKPSEYFEATVK